MTVAWASAHAFPITGLDPTMRATDELSRIRFAARCLAIACLVFIGTNLTTLYVVTRAYGWVVPSLRGEIALSAHMAGSSYAGARFRAGRTQQMRVAEGDDKREMRGPDGQILVRWTFVADIPGSRESAEAFVKAFNDRMDVMLRKESPPAAEQPEP